MVLLKSQIMTDWLRRWSAAPLLSASAAVAMSLETFSIIPQQRRPVFVSSPLKMDEVEDNVKGRVYLYRSRAFSPPVIPTGGTKERREKPADTKAASTNCFTGAAPGNTQRKHSEEAMCRFQFPPTPRPSSWQSVSDDVVVLLL